MISVFLVTLSDLRSAFDFHDHQIQDNELNSHAAVNVFIKKKLSCA